MILYFNKKSTKRYLYVILFIEIIINQNKIIVGLVSEIKVSVNAGIKPGQTSAKYLDLFPVRTTAEIQQVEDEINENSKCAMVNL